MGKFHFKTIHFAVKERLPVTVIAVLIVFGLCILRTQQNAKMNWKNPAVLTFYYEIFEKDMNFYRSLVE